jgi:hypothetical protein
LQLCIGTVWISNVYLGVSVLSCGSLIPHPGSLKTCLNDLETYNRGYQEERLKENRENRRKREVWGREKNYKKAEISKEKIKRIGKRIK